MRNHYQLDSNTVIHCTNCRNRLRVPVDKGKITVKCPVCKREFLYNPNSIIDTIKQIGISTAFSLSRLSKNRRNRLFLIGAAIVIIIVLIFFISGKFKPGIQNSQPGPMVYEMSQEFTNNQIEA